MHAISMCYRLRLVISFLSLVFFIIYIGRGSTGKVKLSFWEVKGFFFSSNGIKERSFWLVGWLGAIERDSMIPSSHSFFFFFFPLFFLSTKHF